MYSTRLDGSLLLQFHEDLDLVLEVCNEIERSQAEMKQDLKQIIEIQLSPTAEAIEIPATIETVIQTFDEADFDYAYIYPEEIDFIFYNPMHSLYHSQPTVQEDIAEAKQTVDQSYATQSILPTNIYQSKYSSQNKRSILCRLTMSSPVLLVSLQRSSLHQCQPVSRSVSTTLFVSDCPVSAVFIFDPSGCRKASRFNSHLRNNDNNNNKNINPYSTR